MANRPADPPQARAHFLDGMRAVLTLFMVAAHAALAYVPRPMPGLLWATRRADPSPFVEGLYWWIACALMPPFFAIAGFAAAELLRARGPYAFVAQRTRRLLLPLLFGGAVVLPVTFYVWAVGWVLEGVYPPHKLRTLAFDDEERRHLYGLAHLWFLEYLYVYCLLYAAVSWLGRWVRPWWRWNAPPWEVWPLLLAAPCALVFWLDTRVLLGFYQTFLPVPSKLVYYAFFFAAGVALRECRHELAKLGDLGLVFAGLSFVAFACALPLIRQHLTNDLTGVLRVLLALLVPLVGALSVPGLFALFQRFCDRPNRAAGFVAEASFWVYLIHLPVVGAVHAALVRVAWPPVVKFVVAFGAAAAITLWSYRLVVRDTRLGVWLNGRRRPRAEHVPESPDAPGQAQPGVAA
jgi:glucans biosynthesis protein C